MAGKTKKANRKQLNYYHLNKKEVNSLTLKEMGVRLGMAKKRIYTSDRRFPKGTIPKLKLMWKMNRLRKMYRDHVPIEKIDRLYRDVR